MLPNGSGNRRSSDSSFKLVDYGFYVEEEGGVLVVFSDGADEGAADDDAICKSSDVVGLFGR